MKYGVRNVEVRISEIKLADNKYVLSENLQEKIWDISADEK
jgi:hypothetical protein